MNTASARRLDELDSAIRDEVEARLKDQQDLAKSRLRQTLKQRGIVPGIKLSARDPKTRRLLKLVVTDVTPTHVICKQTVLKGVNRLPRMVRFPIGDFENVLVDILEG